MLVGVCLIALGLWPLAGLLPLALGMLLAVIGVCLPSTAPSWRGRGLIVVAVALAVPAFGVQLAAFSLARRWVEGPKEYQADEQRWRELVRAKVDLIHIAAAVESYATATGALPAPNAGFGLPADLVQEGYLEVEPTDPFGRPDDNGYRYAALGNEYVICGRGPDGMWEDVALEHLLLATDGERMAYHFDAEAGLESGGDLYFFGYVDE